MEVVSLTVESDPKRARAADYRRLARISQRRSPLQSLLVKFS
jgi:hypothetical protein